MTCAGWVPHPPSRFLEGDFIRSRGHPPAPHKTPRAVPQGLARHITAPERSTPRPAAIFPAGFPPWTNARSPIIPPTVGVAQAQHEPAFQPSAVHRSTVFTPFLYNHLRQDEVINNTRPAFVDAAVNHQCPSRRVTRTVPAWHRDETTKHIVASDPLLPGSSVSPGWREGNK